MTTPALLATTLLVAGGAEPLRSYTSRLPAREVRLSVTERARVLSLARQAVSADARGSLPCSADEITINGAVPGPFTRMGARQIASLYTLCYAHTGRSQGLLVLDGMHGRAHLTFVADDYGVGAFADLNRHGITGLACQGHPLSGASCRVPFSPA